MTVTGCCYRKSPKRRRFFSVFWRPFWKWPKFWRRILAPLMVTYHHVKLYVSIIIHLEVINIDVRNFNFPIGFYSKPHPLWTPQNIPQSWKLKVQLETYIYNSTKFHEILSSSSWDLPWTRSCRKEKRRIIIIIIIIIIITISLQTTFGRLNYHTLTVTMTLNQFPYAHGHHGCKSITMRSRPPRL